MCSAIDISPWRTYYPNGASVHQCLLIKEVTVNVVPIADLELMEMWARTDDSARTSVTFPFFAGNGTQDLAVVYFEVAPGHHLATHTDSAEELLLVLDGEGEVTVGGESGRIKAREMAIVPELVPHGIRNTGSTTLRVVGVFANGSIESIFEDDLMPVGMRMFRTADLLAV